MKICGHQSGLTLVELLVVISVSGILTTLVTSFGLTYWGNSITLGNSQATLVSRLNASDFINNAIDQATGLINQNDLADSNTNNPDPTDLSGTHWLPIHAIPGLINIGNVGITTPVIYYSRPSITATKNVIMNGSAPYEDNVIFYLNGSTKQLLARTIANSSASGNQAKTSCPPAIATTNCPADFVVADNVTGVSMRYFSRSGNAVDYTSVTDPNTGAFMGPDFPSVEIVEFTLKLSQKAQFHNAANSTNQTVIRVALRN